MANSVFEVLAFLKTSQATNVPDLQLHLLPWAYTSPNQDEPIRHDVDKRTSLTVLSTLIYPKSRGTLRLASTDPTASPLIDFQYLADPSDLEVLAEGSEMVREIFAGAAFGGSIKGETHPGKELQGQALRDAILNRATSVYHGVGTCRMGVDELAVVGPDLKVRGVEGLRVCDASIMPSITGGNTNAPAIMIGEMGASLVLEREPRHDLAATRVHHRRLPRQARRPGPVDQRRHLEAHRGLHRRGARRAAAVDPRGRRARVRRGAGRPGGVGRPAAQGPARGLQAGPHAVHRQRGDHDRPDPGRVRQEPPDGDRGDLRPGDGDEPLPQAGAQAAQAGQARRAGADAVDLDRDPAAQGRHRDHRARGTSRSPRASPTRSPR